MDPFGRAAVTLMEASSVALACHVNPDADALGSMLGLSNHLRAMGKQTLCSFPNEPFELPRWTEMLPGHDALVPPGEFPEHPDVMVTCDVASMDRLAMLGGPATRAKHLIWIDHHVTNEGLGTIALIDPRASSTCELVWRLVHETGLEPSTQTATCIYAGLVTDTGRFQYEAVRPDTLRLAAELREFPFDHAALVQALYEDNSVAYLKLLGVALERVRLEPDVDMVWSYLTRADLDDAGVHPAETDDLIDVIRTAREADIAVVLKEQRDGGFKVSMRSRGRHDVAGVAAAFGGGGHRLAAGYTSTHGLADTVERLKGALAGAPVEP
ncbi:MAG TPA: bifunctional oligoribonuclease/PAP phosphatase NrnA [Actinomycetota bacterium]|nr:bifunctional oligoribonuclease/PAP phosphatase NrnA [Actinomycetota bacterium]